jgi:hypothetical protein
MNITSQINIRRAGNALLSLGIAGAGVGALIGTSGAASASASPKGFATVISCTSVVGKTSFKPGLLKTTARLTTAKASANVTGCNSADSGSLPGAGSLTATLAGSARLQSENFSGTFAIAWPGGTLNPSYGTVHVHESNSTEYFAGVVTSGAFTGAPVEFTYVTTSSTGTGSAKRPVKSQSFVNSTLLTVRENFG